MSDSDGRVSTLGTPILNSGILPPRTRKRSVGGILGGFAVGALLGLVMVKVVGSEPYPGQALLIFAAAVALSITVHEFGHLLAGWALGFRFSFVSIGPFSLRLEHGLLKVQVRREMAALGYAGMHVNGVIRLRRRMLAYVAAGPAANLTSAALALILTNRTFVSRVPSWLSFLAGEFAVISLFLFVVGLVPMRSTPSSDGSRIAMLLGSRDRTRRWVSTIAVGGQQRDGTRPRDWKQSWLKAATSLHDDSVDEFSGNWAAYVSANARKDSPLAAAHLERCLQLVHLLRPSFRDLVAQEAAVFSAWFRKDVLLAEKWITQIKRPNLLQPLLRIRMNLALCCARRDFAGAAEIWQQGFALIEKLPATLTGERLRESWLEWQTEIQERQDEPATA